MKVIKLILFCLLMIASNRTFGQEPSVYIHQILASYDSTSIVAFGERHNQQQLLDFYVELIHTEEFQQRVNDIVLELGNSFYQKELDDFIFGRSDSDVMRISDVWRSATNSLIQFGDEIVVRTIIDEVRNVNEHLSESNKIRVLAVDPPLNWKTIEKPNDFWPWVGRRDRYFTSLIWDEVIDKKRNAFFIAGRQHLIRNDPKPPNYVGVIDLLESRLGKGITIIHLDSDVDSSKVFPKLTLVRKSHLAGKKIKSDFELIYNDAIDAVLYVGELTSIQTDPYTNAAFLAELDRRSQIIFGSPFRFNSYDYLKYMISKHGESGVDIFKLELERPEPVVEYQEVLVKMVQNELNDDVLKKKISALIEEMGE